MKYPEIATSANDIFYPNPDNFVNTDVESEETVYDTMRKYYFETEKILTSENAGLIYLSRVCMVIQIRFINNLKNWF